LIGRTLLVHAVHRLEDVGQGDRDHLLALLLATQMHCGPLGGGVGQHCSRGRVVAVAGTGQQRRVGEGGGLEGEGLAQQSAEPRPQPLAASPVPFLLRSVSQASPVGREWESAHLDRDEHCGNVPRVLVFGGQLSEELPLANTYRATHATRCVRDTRGRKLTRFAKTGGRTISRVSLAAAGSVKASIACVNAHNLSLS